MSELPAVAEGMQMRHRYAYLGEVPGGTHVVIVAVQPPSRTGVAIHIETCRSDD